MGGQTREKSREGNRRGSGTGSGSREKNPPLLYYFYFSFSFYFGSNLVVLIHYCSPKYPKIHGNIRFIFAIVLCQDNNAEISSLLCLNLILTSKCQCRKIIIRSKNNNSS